MSQPYLRPLRLTISLVALVLTLAHLLMPDLTIDHITIALLVIAALPWLTPFIKSFEIPGGWKFEIREEVKRELKSAAIGTLEALAQLDERLIKYWERDRHLRLEEGDERLELSGATIAELEAKYTKASQIERVLVGLALRELYWQLLDHARQHYGSADQYQQIRSRVVAGLKRLSQVSKDAT